MKIKKLLMTFACIVSLLSFSSCNQEKPREDTLYVKKVDNLKEGFIKGMDASSVISLENAGVKYYDYDGKEEDPLKILADNGINYIRVRVWNDPFDADGNGYGGGNCNIDTAVALGKRATQYGMKLLVNFHYSDFWADPAKQMVPKAWTGMGIDDKADALYNYTKESLTKLKNENVDVGMVQVGNETNAKMSGETIWFNIAKLMAAGSRATREVFPDAKIALHFANPEKTNNYRNYASKLAYYNIDYDVFASSYYPYWHGSLENLTSILDEISKEYNKDVMCAETSYAYTADDTDFYGNTVSDGGTIVKTYPFTIQGQAQEVRDVIEAINNCERGIGVFYWEGTWISTGGNSYEENKSLWEEYGTGWASSFAGEYDPNDAGKYAGGNAVDNQAFFDENGNVLESLRVFDLVDEGNIVELKPDAIEDTTLIFDLNGEIVLPTTVNAIMNDGSKQVLDVEWEEIDVNAMKNNGVAKYTVEGTANGMKAYAYISMVEYNFLTNYSFEDGEEGWTINAIKKSDELYIEDKTTDSLTGSKHVHFWSSATDSVEFSVEQEVKNLPAGSYKYSISIMGGDGGTTDIYSYVKINGEIVLTAPLEITTYGNWDTAVISGINYNGSDTIVVGIYVKCQGSGAGAWGKIDDALLNSTK